MAKRVFFSFHYKNVSDFRVNVIRNHWKLKPDRGVAGFFDASIWETAQKTSDLALKRLINKGISNTSNSCVLIGKGTYNRRWVRYEIFKSLATGNHLFGVHINKIKSARTSATDNYGLNPFDYLGFMYSDDGKMIYPIEYKNSKWVYSKDYEGYKLVKPVVKSKWGTSYKLSKKYKTYCWIKDDGYNNFSKWVK